MGLMSYALALFCVNHGLAQPLLLVEELAVELRKLFIAGLADAEQDCLELLQVLCCCRHRQRFQQRALGLPASLRRRRAAASCRTSPPEQVKPDAVIPAFSNSIDPHGP